MISDSQVGNVRLFLSKCKNFNRDLKKKLDRKHKTIVGEGHKKILSQQEKFIENFKDWELQGDFGSPIQFSLEHLRLLGVKKNIKNLIKKFLFFEDKDFKRSFFDDLKILEKSKAFNILKKNPIHKTYGVKDFYFYKNFSTNYRWNRYAYLSNNIIKKKLLCNSEIHVDLGSYYGGLQSFLYSEFKECKFFLIDFNHQLLRSFIFLKNQFPNANHFLPDDVIKSIKKKIKPGFYYLSIDDFFKIKSLKPNLFSNSFSLGEMPNSFFENYISSKIIKKSNFLYLINRFVSAPFFEKTYENNKNIKDYFEIKKFKLNYLDVFPIHHYQIIKRNLFNVVAKRPISSPYFEMILKNENWR